MDKRDETRKIKLTKDLEGTQPSPKDTGDDDDDDDDDSSDISDVSGLSGLSDMSGQQWNPMAGRVNWIESLMLKGANPREILHQMTGDENSMLFGLSDRTLWRLIASLLSEPPRRSHLPNINSLEDVVRLIKECKKIMVLTGAGVSVSCGIPDFRSRDGVYSRLAVDFPDLPDPQAMFDITYFRKDPRPFFKFAKEIYPGQFKPSPSHRFIRTLEKHGKLIRNYTQNIDTLENVAGIENVIECHGSFATATCTKCGHKVSAEDIREDVFNQRIPFCPVCAKTKEAPGSPCPEPREGGPGEPSEPDCPATPTDTPDRPSSPSLCDKGIMKPDIVFFGEGLPEAFHDAMGKDKDECDLLIVMGSSLKVRPVALIPSSIPAHVPQILINRERLGRLNFDVELLGDSDVIVDHICRQLGPDWQEVCWREEALTDSTFQRQGFKSDSNYSTTDDETSNQGSELGMPVKCQRIGRRQGVEERDEGEGASRHLSLDSTRDSGIGEASSCSSSTMSSTGRSPSPSPNVNLNLPLAALYKDSFYRSRKRRYIFPGAEVNEGD